MRNKYWKYICLLALGACCWACSDDDVDSGQGGQTPGTEGQGSVDQDVTRSYKIGTLAGFEGDIRQKMDIAKTSSTTMYNRSLFYRYVESAYGVQADEEKRVAYPSGVSEQDWWDNFVEEVAYSGQDYVAMNCRGQINKDNDHGRPDKLPAMLEAIKRKGLEGKFKIAIFDDTPASWSAARNQYKGYGYSNKPVHADTGNRIEGSEYPLLFMDPELADVPKGNANNEFRKEIYQYIWDYNLKEAFKEIDREYWFTIDGRPLIYFWNPNGFLQDSFLSELSKKYPNDEKYQSTTGLDYTKADAYHGKLSYILECISEDFEKEFGVRPFLVIQREWTDRDFTLVNCPALDGIHNWFSVPQTGADMKPEEIDKYNEDLKYNTYISGYNFKGFTVGSGCPGFVQGNLDKKRYQYIDADHGKYATRMLESFVTSKPDLVFLEGFTDVVENAAWWRSSDKTYYDYPNQRLNLLRKYSNHPFPTEQRLEAEGCDYCYSATVTGGKIEAETDAVMNNAPEQKVVKRCDDDKFYGGWHTELSSTALNTLTWKELPFRTGNSTIRFRYASDAAVSVSCQVGEGMVMNSTLPATGGNWTEEDVVVYNSEGAGYNDFTLTVTDGNIKLNYVEINAKK